LISRCGQGWEEGTAFPSGATRKGLYTPEADGTLQLVLDNSSSRLTSKSLQLKVMLVADAAMAAMQAHEVQTDVFLDDAAEEARIQEAGKTKGAKKGRFGGKSSEFRGVEGCIAACTRRSWTGRAMTYAHCAIIIIIIIVVVVVITIIIACAGMARRASLSVGAGMARRASLSVASGVCSLLCNTHWL
jgi:hypothetical protein